MASTATPPAATELVDAIRDVVPPHITHVSGPGPAVTFESPEIGDRWVHVTGNGPTRVWLFFGGTRSGATPPSSSFTASRAARAIVDYLLG